MFQDFKENRRPGSEDLEKVILRRRKQQLCDVIQVNDKLIRELEKSGLLTEESTRKILLEKTNSMKVSRVLEAVGGSRVTEPLHSFSVTLSSAGYIWLGADLVTELAIERGDFVPDPSIVNEAAILVHRKFGTSKRFSETDKKELSEMIALKLQIARSEWDKETKRLKEQLEEERLVLESRQQLAMIITNIQKEFVRTHEAQLVSHAHDMMTTRQLIQKILNEAPRDGEVLFQFKENLEKFLKQISSALSHRDALYYEKEKCLRLLGVKDDTNASLEEVISRATGLIVNANMETENKDDVIEKLNRNICELETQNSVQVKNVKDLKRQIAERDRDISKLRQMVNIK